MDRVRAFQSHIAPRTAVGTREAYGAAVRKFNVFMEMESIPYDALPANLLSRYAAHILSLHPNLSPSSVQVYVKGVKQYLLWLRREGVLIPAFRTSPTRNHPAPATRPRTLTAVEFDAFALFSATQPDPWKTIMLCQTLVPVPLDAMVRLEASALKIVQRPKTIPTSWIVVDWRRRRRKVPVVPAVFPVLARYLRVVRPSLGSSAWLFPAPWRDHRPVSSSPIRSLYRDFTRESGTWVSGPVLYRSALQQLSLAGLDAAALSQIAGVEAPSMAMDLPIDSVHPSWDAVYHAASRVTAPWLKGLS